MFINTGTFFIPFGHQTLHRLQKPETYFYSMGLCSHTFNEMIYLIGMFMYVQISISYSYSCLSRHTVMNVSETLQAVLYKMKLEIPPCTKLT